MKSWGRGELVVVNDRPDATVFRVTNPDWSKTRVEIRERHFAPIVVDASALRKATAVQLENSKWVQEERLGPKRRA